MTAGFAAQRELTKRALSEGPEGLLAALASQVDGWAALYDATGAVVATAPEWAGRRAALLTAEVERLWERPLPASSVVGGSSEEGEDEDRVELHSLGTGKRPLGVLAVGTAAALGTAERYAVHSAIALLTLTTERSRSLYAAEQRIGAAVLRMLLAGQPDHARAAAGDLYGELLDAPYRVILAEAGAVPGTRGRGVGGGLVSASPSASGADAGVAEAEGDPVVGFAEVVEAAAARSGEAVLVVPDGERLVVLAADGGAVVASCAQYAEALLAERGSAEQGGDDDELVVGLSAPAGPIAAAAAYKQAEQALSVARRRGRVLVEHEELAAGSVVPLLADDAVRAFADGLLRALHEHDATGRGTWWLRCGPGCRAMGSGMRLRRILGCIGIRCATGCGGSRRSSDARWTIRIRGWSFGWP